MATTTTAASLFAGLFTAPPPTKMEYVRLGTSGLKISKIVLGAMSYGTKEWQSWVLDEDEALPLLKHAYEVGINTWDTVCLLDRYAATDFFRLMYILMDVRRS